MSACAASDVQPLVLGKLELNPGTRVLSGPSGHVELSRRYFVLAEKLLRRPGMVITHSDLIAVMYADPDDEPDNSTGLLYQAIGKLRTIIEVLNGRNVQISTVRDIGYRMQDMSRRS